MPDSDLPGLNTSFRDPGRYTVTVEVEDGFGRVGIDHFRVTVVPKPDGKPTVVLRAPSTATIGRSGGQAVVELDASGSTSNAKENKKLTFEWDLDGDGRYDEGGGFAKVTHTYYDDGRRTVGVRVIDIYRNSDERTAQIDVLVDATCAVGALTDVVVGPVKATGCFTRQPFAAGGEIYLGRGRIMVNGVTFVPKQNPGFAERAGFSDEQRAACQSSASCTAALDALSKKPEGWWIDTRHHAFGTTSPYSVEIPGLFPIQRYRSNPKNYRIGFAPDAGKISFSTRGPQARTLDSIFGFDVGSFQELTLKRNQQKRSSVYSVGLRLPGLGEIPGLGGFSEFENSVTIRISEGGVPHYDGISIALPELPLEFLTFASFQLTYKGSDNSWSGEGFLRFPSRTFGGKAAAGDPNVDDLAIRVSLRFVDGKFKELFGRLSGINKHISNGIFLQRIGLGVEVNPFTLKGDVRLTAGPTIKVNKKIVKLFQKETLTTTFFGKYLQDIVEKAIDGFDVGLAPFVINAAVELRGPGRRTMSLPPPTCANVLCADRQYTFDAPFSMRIDGNVNVIVIPIAAASAEFMASDPVFLRAFVRWGVDLGFFNMSAEAAGWIYGTDFNLGAQVQLGIPAINVDIRVQGAASNKGFAACGQLTKDLAGGVAILWKEKIKLIDGCNLAPYKTRLDVDRLTADRSPRSASRAARPRAAGAAAYPLSGFTLTMPANTPQAAIRLVGDGAPPNVRLTGPDGRQIDVSTAGGVSTETELGLQDPNNAETVITMANPGTGRWTVQGLPGSPDIVDVLTSGLLPEPKVKATVTTSRTKSTLRWTSTGMDAGVRLQFTEQGPGASQPIVTTSKASGTVVWTPSRTGIRRREIYVSVERDGLPLKTDRLTAFTAPKPPRLHRVKKLRGTRKGHGVVLRFQAPKGGAKLYALEVTMRAGPMRAATRISPSRTKFFVPLVNPRHKVVASVRAIGITGKRGPRVSVRLPARRR